MRKLRALLAAVIITICGLLLGGLEGAAAADSGMEITADQTAVRGGEKITLTFGLGSHADVTDGANALKGTLTVDQDVFEDVSSEDFETLNSWERLFYNPDNGQFILINRAGSKGAESVFRIRLKAKETVPAKETFVGVKDTVISEGKADLVLPDVTFDLDSVSAVPPAEDSGEDYEEISGIEQGESDNIGSDSSGDGNDLDKGADLENGSAGEAQELGLGTVRTGDSGILFWLFLGALLISLILVAVLLTERRKGRLSSGSMGGRILTGILLITLAASAVLGSAAASTGKGDLNEDGSVDYTDVELLEKHLIELELLPENRERTADLNSDGDLTVSDLSILIRRIEKSLDYKVELSSVTDRFYYEKQEMAELKFYAEGTCGARIRSVMVNDAEYDVELQQDGSVYSVKINAGEQAGVREFHFTEALLDNGQKVNVDHREKIDVLKNAPSVEGFLAEDLTDSAQMKVSFDLKDEDGALDSARVEVVKKDDGSLNTGETIRRGENEFVLDLEEGTAYEVRITAEYNRDSDELEPEEDHTGSILVTREIALNLDYQFTFGGMKAGTADGEQKDQFSRNEPVILFFESSNATSFLPERLTVNGMAYQVEKGDGGSYVTLEGFEKPGDTLIRAEELVLENGKSFELGEDQKLSVMILKFRPELTELEAREDEKNREFRVKFSLKDEDDALTAHRVRMIKADGSVAGEMAFGAEDLNQGTFDREIPLTDSGLTTAYTVQVTADCDLTSDGSGVEREVILGELTVKAQPRIHIADSQADVLYVEKGGEVILTYELAHNLDEELAALVINNREIPVTGPDSQGGSFQADDDPAESDQTGTYQIAVSVSETAGVQEVSLSQAVFSEGTIVDTESSVSVEVLRDIPSVGNLIWSRTQKDELETVFELLDPDGALLKARIRVEEEGGKVLLDEAVSAGENSVSAALTVKENYVITVTADYDRDSDSLEDQSNLHVDEVLYMENVAVSNDALELKDITAQRLYYAGGNGPEEIAILDVTGGLPEEAEHYYAVIEMESMPDLYAGIREFTRDGDSGRVYAHLDQKDLIRHEADGTRVMEHAFPVAYRDENGEHPLITGAEDLIRRMAANPGGSFELTEDLDASGISAADAAVAGTFSGELDGNGYRIQNLPTSLFSTLSGAHIHDLVIEDASVTADRSGILAQTIQNRSVVENVFIKDSAISNSVDGMGAFGGRLVNSTIRESASVNVSVRGLVAVGGIVGKTESGALIENCYVTGKVQGTYDHPSLGARTGGITGWHGGGSISRCYTQAQIIAPASKGNGGLIGGPDKGTPDIAYSLSMSSGAGYRIAGFDVLGDVREVYEYSGSSGISNITEENQSNVKETDRIYSMDFYKDTLGFDEDIWDLDGLSYGKRPALKNAPVEENHYEIPGYSAVLNHENYRPERELAYANMAELLPLSDTRLWVEYGNLADENDRLVTGRLRYVLPLDESGSLVSGIRREDPAVIRTIRLVYEDGTMQEYPVTCSGLTGDLAAVYRMEGTGLKYQFHRYITDMDEALFSEMAAKVSGYDYASEIADLTPEDESRLYTDYYNENVKPRMETVLQSIIASGEDYPTYSTHPAVRALAEERMKDEDALKRMLYAYNYYDKWYRIDYSGVLLSDLLFFDGGKIAAGITAEKLTDQLLTAAAGQRDTNQTVTFYNNVLKNYIGENLTDFLGGLAKSVAGYGDPNEWFKDGFDGVLVEEKARGDEGKIRYRIWDNLSGLEEGRKSLVLQILTAPQEDMYLISVPSQLIIGSMNRYPEYLNKDGQERERIRRTAEIYAEKMGVFYGVSSRWMQNAADQLNSFVNIQYDTRLNFPESEAASAGAQEKGQTRDPVMKWVYEANNMLNALNGSAAVADGSIVIWMWDAALGTSDYSFFTFSHETAHNQDGRYFYGGAGRREGTGGEAHADGNIAQEMRDGIMVFNISTMKEIGTEMTNNFSYERIDSAEKVHSYYREMFETGYVLDYLAAQAFLELTPKQQAAVAVKAEHTSAGNASMRTVYRTMTEEEIRAMGLKDMEDLWENKISVRTSRTYPENVGTATDGSYGFESFYTMNWYQSHNDDGSPDTHSFKRLGQEMLGLAGYEKGYMVYMSALSKNDLDALRQVTGNPDITWKGYKMGRYRTVEQNLDQIPYFDKDEVIAQFKAAFEEDAASGNRNVSSIETKRMLYGMIKRVTGDFSEGGIYRAPAAASVTSAEQLIRLAQENPYGYYRLENDLDFSQITASGDSYIPGRFIGFLDGNGCSLTGMQYPVFGDLQYAHVWNLTIQDPSYASDARALLSVKTKKAVIGNVRTEGADMPLPLIGTKTEGYYEYGDMTVTVGERKITAAEELLAIGESPEALKKKYVLAADIDFAGVTVQQAAVTGTFSGELDGNGYTITGLNAPLFERTEGAVIENLNMENISLAEDSQKGALANEIRNSTVQNVRVADLGINHNGNQAGGLAGVISGSTVKQISVENLSMRASNTLGGIAGQFDGNLLSDCIVTGTIEGTLVHPMGARIGGITGWLGNGIVRNCLAKVEITAPERIGNGGLIGGPQTGSAAVESSVSLSTGVNANRVSGWNVLGITSSVYELEDSDSQTNADLDAVTTVTADQLKEKQFYTDELGWSEEVWNFDALAAGGVPGLRR